VGNEVHRDVSAAEVAHLLELQNDGRATRWLPRTAASNATHRSKGG
jgi:hypothetical protein